MFRSMPLSVPLNEVDRLILIWTVEPIELEHASLYMTLNYSIMRLGSLVFSKVRSARKCRDLCFVS